MRLHEVGDAMSNYPGFSAAGAGEQEKGAIHVSHGGSLLWIQAFEKIHPKSSSDFNMPPRIWLCREDVVEDKYQ